VAAKCGKVQQPDLGTEFSIEFGGNAAPDCQSRQVLTYWPQKIAKKVPNTSTLDELVPDRPRQACHARTALLIAFCQFD
jgi:hypothetical protein